MPERAVIKVGWITNPRVRRPVMLVTLPFALVGQVMLGIVGTVRALGGVLRSFGEMW